MQHGRRGGAGTRVCRRLPLEQLHARRDRQSAGDLLHFRLHGGFGLGLGVLQGGDDQILEDLIVAAFQDAKGKAEAAVQAKMQELTGGLPIPPGLKLF